MTKQHSTASHADPKHTAYPTATSNTVSLRVAEDEGEYGVTPSADKALNQTLKHLELKATGNAIAGQITRLYGLVNVLLPEEQPTDRTGEELRQVAIELEQATEIIEQTVNSLLSDNVKE